MPIPPPCSDQPSVICCDSIFTVVQNIAIIAGEAVRNCFGETCGEIPIYVSHGEPQGGGDYVAAWLASITPPPILQGKTFFVVSQLNVNLAVCLDGFPGIKIQGGDMAPIPSADEHTHAAYFTYGAMEAAYRAITSTLTATGVLGGCTVAGFTQLVPNLPAAGSARWMMTVRLEQR